MADTIAWLSTASNEVTRGPATLRLYYLFGRDSNLLEAKIITDQLLMVLEKKLTEIYWLVGNSISIADIAIFPYIALSYQGNIDLSEYDNVNIWINRIKSLHGYVDLPI